MMKKYFNKQKEKLQSFSNAERFLLLTLIGLFFWLLYYNITTAYFHMDSDVVVDSIMIPKIVGERGLFFNDWIFGHEAMFSRPFIVTMFVRLFVDDWIMAVKIGISITTFVILCLFYTFCRRASLSRSAAFISMIFLLGVNVSIFNNFRGDTFYPTFVIIPLLTCILLIDLKKSQFRLKIKQPAEGQGTVKLDKKNVIKLAALFVTAMISGLFGIRMMAVLFLPLVAVEFFHAAGKIRGNDSIDKDSMSDLIKQQKSLFVAVALCLVNGLGIMVLSLYNIYAGAFVPASTNIQGVSEIFDNLLPAARNTLLETLCIPLDGIWTRHDNFIPIFAEGALRIFILALCVFTLLYIFKKRKSLSPQTVFANDYLIASFVVVFCIMVVIGQLSPKYFYFVWYPLTFGVACAVDNKVVKTTLYRRFSAIVAGVLCIVSVYNNDLRAINHARENDAKQLTHYRIAKYLTENEYETVYGNFWNSALIASYSNMKLGAGYLNADTFRAEMWAVDKRVYYDNDRGKYALVLSDDDLNVMRENLPKYKLDFIESETTIVTKIGYLNILETELNPLPAFRQPIFKNDKSVYEFSRNYAAKSDGAIVSFNGNYVDTGDAYGQFIWGPYVTLLKGTYELTVNYETLEENASAEFSVTARLGEIHLGGHTLEKQNDGANRVTFTIVLPEHLGSVEFNVHANGGQVRLYNAEVKKIR